MEAILVQITPLSYGSPNSLLLPPFLCPCSPLGGRGCSIHLICGLFHRTVLWLTEQRTARVSFLEVLPCLLSRPDPPCLSITHVKRLLWVEESSFPISAHSLRFMGDTYFLLSFCSSASPKIRMPVGHIAFSSHFLPHLRSPVTI